MRHTIGIRIILLVICLTACGCGDGAGDATTDPPADADAPAARETLAMVLETSEPTYWRDGEEVKTIDDVRAILLAQQISEDAGYTLQIDDSHAKDGQLRVVYTVDPGADAEVDLQAVAEAQFNLIKERFDQRAEGAGLQEEAHLRRQVEAASAEVSRLQKELSELQAFRRGLSATDESRLEMRKFNRRIENALAQQIALEKAVDRAQRRNDRKRYVTVVRVR